MPQIPELRGGRTAGECCFERTVGQCQKGAEPGGTTRDHPVQGTCAHKPPAETGLFQLQLRVPREEGESHEEEQGVLPPWGRRDSASERLRCGWDTFRSGESCASVPVRK